MVSISEVRVALMGLVLKLAELRGNEIDVVSMDGKSVRGVWEDDEQLKLLHLFSREGSMALDQVEIARHEPRAAEEWIRSLSAHFPSLKVLSGDALYADTSLAETIALVIEGASHGQSTETRCPAICRPTPTLTLKRPW